MYWWQKPSVGDSPSLSLSLSDDIYFKSSGFRKSWSFKSQDCPIISCAKKLRSSSSSSVNETTLRPSDVVKSINNLPRARSDENSMAPQPLPLPELATNNLHPSNSTAANVRLPSPPGLIREEREKSDGHRRDGHATGDTLNLISGISSKIASQGARRNADHAETLASRRLPGRRFSGEIARNYKLNVPISIPVSSFSSPSLSPGTGNNASDTFTSHHLSPPAFQNWSAPELPSDMILGHEHPYYLQEKSAVNADNSSLHNQKMHFGHNAISPHGAVSPLLRISSDTSTPRRDTSNQTNVHPLPLPPTAATASQPLPSPIVAAKPEKGKSHWNKGKLIGRGTFGSVYVGSDRETGALCAMKEVELVANDQKSAECIRQLEQEIQLLRHLKHPNIVQYYGSETVGDRFYIYLEYVHPGSLVHYIRDHCGAITEPIVRNFTRHILSGLAYLHSTKTIHRDIKGANLLVDAYGVVKLADFGMAKHLNGQTANLSLKGSPYWMAPELLQPDLQNDTGPDLALAVDIWSLGCTIIEMMDGKPPWSEYEGPAAMFKVLKETPPIPETLSPEGKDFLHWCFRRNPAERPSARMLLEHPFMKNSLQDKAHPGAEHPIHKQVSTSAESTKKKVSNSETIRKTVSEISDSKVLPRQYSSGSIHEALQTSNQTGFGHSMDHSSPSSSPCTKKIFKEYSEKFGKNSGLVENSRSGSRGIVGSSVGREWLGGFQDFVASRNLAEQTRKNWLPDLKDGKSEKVVEDGSSMMCDLSYSDRDLEF
ncbi:MAP protein kinase [Heracleum sosnowskyi]|uniref:mitogen-activated protein kinase kinase kinase n=1 Tax=Heracleum sosnowskyi TaxID=360622 RepID=A0AAD8M6D4_9APIA|nr:MAP protein kinase [Heracleum sosnowskyi]